VNKAGFLSSAGVVLSLHLKRSYEPLRLPTRACVLSLPYTRRSAASPPPGLDLQHWATNLQVHADPATPGVDGATSVVPAPIQRPSPSVHGVGFSTSFTRLLIGSLALRPALLLCGNLRPRVAATPLPHATEVYGQLPGRDFNPLDLILLLRTDRPRFNSRWKNPVTASMHVTMLSLVIDTTVFFCGLRSSGGASREVLRRALNGAFQPLFGNALLAALDRKPLPRSGRYRRCVTSAGDSGSA